MPLCSPSPFPPPSSFPSVLSQWENNSLKWGEDGIYFLSKLFPALAKCVCTNGLHGRITPCLSELPKAQNSLGSSPQGNFVSAFLHWYSFSECWQQWKLLYRWDAGIFTIALSRA